MAVIRGIVIAVAGLALVIFLAVCQPAAAYEALPASVSQALSTLSGKAAPQAAGEVVWGKVPYCNCFANSASAGVNTATANVSTALQKANLSVSLKELSPRDGWLYFRVTFDPHSATRDQVGAAMVAGGAQLLEGPP